MRSDDTPDRPNVRPVSLDQNHMRRRRLRLCEGLALGLLAVIMAGAWFVTLAG